MAKKIKLSSRQIIIFIVVAIIALAIVVSAVVSQIRITQSKILFESDFTNPSYKQDPANARKWGQDDNGETVKLGKIQSNAKNGYDAKESLTVKNVTTQWTKFHDITEPNTSFSIRATVMLVENGNRPKETTPTQKEITPDQFKPSDYGFGLILKERKNGLSCDGESERSYKLNVFQGRGANVTPYEIHKLLIRASRNSVSFYIGENAKPAIGEDASRKLKKSFILVDGIKDKCVGFFVDPKLTVAFYDLKAETYLISDVESELRDEIIRLTDKLIDTETTLQGMITQFNQDLDSKITSTKNLIELEKDKSNKIAKEKATTVADRLKNIDDGISGISGRIDNIVNGTTQISVNDPKYPNTNLNQIYRDFYELKNPRQ